MRLRPSQRNMRRLRRTRPTRSSTSRSCTRRARSQTRNSPTPKQRSSDERLRADVWCTAIDSEVSGTGVDLGTLFTEDVEGWSPIATMSGLADLADAGADRDTAFSNVEVLFRGIDEVGNKAVAEWLIECDHTGPFDLGDDAAMDATGRHVVLAGITVAEFRGGKIRSFRTYFDEVSLLEQIVGDRVAGWTSRSRTSLIPAISKSSNRTSVVKRRPRWRSATNSTWRSSSAKTGTVVAGISGWTWGNCCELQNLWVEPSRRGRGLATRLLAAAEAEAAARGCSQTVHFTYDFQARALYEKSGYELVGRVEDFPSGTDVLWFRKPLRGRRTRR